MRLCRAWLSPEQRRDSGKRLGGAGIAAGWDLHRVTLLVLLPRVPLSGDLAWLHTTEQGGRAPGAWEWGLGGIWAEFQPCSLWEFVSKRFGSCHGFVFISRILTGYFYWDLHAQALYFLFYPHF